MRRKTKKHLPFKDWTVARVRRTVKELRDAGCPLPPWCVKLMLQQARKAP